MKKTIVVTLVIDMEKVNPEIVEILNGLFNHPDVERLATQKLREYYEEDGIKGVTVERINIFGRD